MKEYLAKNGKRQFKQALSDVQRAAGEHAGFCLACGVRVDGIEPDARRYLCEECGAEKVYGAEELALMGLVY